ncbi:PH domain-containing protein [Nocardia fluminea]|uniref:PH (Pleckstrin Homology) domain-containing protein n=1 Tax=Nocardia fluminea TaxID=134984 RepID=A0A2N3VAL7_9NOCA|nr:PH domain-containing protein [Nocardia fluminea]PKV78636.1 PH (Pleckstrin Homology) domain-containing protein [Nocardia fluminea]
MNDAQPVSWSTPTAGLLAVTGGGILLVVTAFLAQDGPSRLLIGVAAFAVLAMSALGIRQRPRLTMVPGRAPRLVVGTLTGPKDYPLDRIDRIRMVSYRRIGRKTAMLEIDVRHEDTERLLIFGRWDLGTNPHDVYDALVVNGFASVTD